MPKNKSNKVSIVMGSQSDFKTMKLCQKVLKLLGIKFETKIIKYFVGKKKIDYTLKDKSLLKLLRKNKFSNVPFGRYLCYSVKVNYLYNSIRKKILKNPKFLIKNENN